MANEPDRPTVDWNRPNAEPQRPTTTWSRSAPTPTQGRPDNSRHPNRQVSRLAHTYSKHVNNFMKNTGGIFEGVPAGPEDIQEGIDDYRDRRNNDENVEEQQTALGKSFKNRHNKNYALEDMYDNTGTRRPTVEKLSNGGKIYRYYE
jgi:hypothetical protein